jgi:hypothetical protein
VGFDLTPPNGTRSAIFKAYEAARSSYEPVGINVGDIGHPCERALWYGFRHVSQLEILDGRKIRLFETGDIEEQRIVDDLISIGVDVRNRQEKVRFVGGHVRGKIDGEVHGIPEAPKRVHLLECKSSNDKGFKALQKDGVEKAKPMHFATFQTYMKGRGLERVHYHCVNKNDDDVYVERVAYDAEFALRTLARAERIIRADDPPSRISEKPTIPPCLWCRHKGVCHEGAWPRRNCRTCLFSTPVLTSENACWDCGKFNRPLTLDEQAAGCPSHLFLPGLVPGEQIDATDSTVTYKLANGETWVNGQS